MTRNSDIEARLRDDIISGRIGFGDRLRIGELAGRYGVSHMPVREALRVLVGEGLIVSEQNRGARVRPVHAGFVEDLFDIRTAIETMLARRAAERRSEAHVAALRETEALLEALVERGELAAVPAVNRDFHLVINNAAGNPGAMSLVDGQWLLFTALWNRYGNPPERFQSVVEDHRHLITAIERRDATGAAALMGAHIEKAKQDLLARMALVEGAASRSA
jgi:DNA-binding GntR family transcriptional regulator